WRDNAPRHVGYDETGANIHEHRRNEDRAIVLHAEDGEDEREKCWISWQTDVGRRNFFRPAQAVNAVLQPVFGNVAVNERIRSDSWKTKNKEQPQRNPSENCKEEGAEILAQELAQAANIARLANIAESTTT